MAILPGFLGRPSSRCSPGWAGTEEAEDAQPQGLPVPAPLNKIISRDTSQPLLFEAT
jgi:hypothetical protein